MFSLKIFNKKDNRTTEFNKTMSTILNILNSKLNRPTKVVSDKNCIEVSFGSSERPSEDGVVAELLIKKTLFINNSDLEDRQKLDAYVSEIRNFCESVSDIENSSYMSLHLRE
jgi:hypothetical protein